MQEDSSDSQNDSPEKLKLSIQKFDTLIPMQAALEYAKIKNLKFNKQHSCNITVENLLQGLRLRGQKIPKELTIIKQEQQQRLRGGLHPQIQQKLKNVTYFAIGIFADDPNMIGPKVTNYKQDEQYLDLEITFLKISGDHYVLFYKPDPSKDLYYLYQSWQKDFSLEYWLEYSDQFQSISTKLYQDKVYPYQDPQEYVARYFAILKNFKITTNGCPNPACDQNQKDSKDQCYCGYTRYIIPPCLQNKKLQLDVTGKSNYKDFDMKQLEEYIAKCNALYLRFTKEQISWLKRLGYFNRIYAYIVPDP